MLRFQVLQGQYGDCFVMRWDGAGKTRTAVIDGGPAGVYKDSLRPHLLALKGPGAAPPLDLDWVMVSHIDDDHINGLLAMMTELRNAAAQSKAAAFRVRRFWFNSFEALAGVKAGTPAAHAAVASLASLGPALPAGQFSHETEAVLASVGQGNNLRDALVTFNLEDNDPVGDFLRSGQPAVDVDGLKVTVVGPLQQQLDDLRNSWIKPEKHTAETASYADQSIPNLSSIICHVTYATGGKTRTMLLTGDGRGDLILTGLEDAGLMPKGGKLHLDLLKVQHHGSSRDVVQDYFERLPADHYVISANGKFSNPDQPTLKWLIAARGNDAYTLHISNQQDWMPAFFAGLKDAAHNNFKVVYRGPLADNTAVDEINLD